MLKEIYDVFRDDKNDIYQIRSKTDVIKIEFDDEEKEKIFQQIMKYYQKNKLTSISLISTEFALKYPKDKVLSVLNELKEAGLLDEERIKKQFIENQLKFWQRSSVYSGKTFIEVQEKIENFKLAILGNGSPLSLLKDKAKLSGFKSITDIEISKKFTDEKLIKLIESNDFLIVENDNWNPGLLEKINEIAIRMDKPWLLMQGIDGMSANLGPLFLGKESGCYNCLISRLKSNKILLPYFESFEEFLRDNKQSAKTEGGPMVIYDMISTMCILETIKYITGFAIPDVYKKIISIDFYSLEIKHHHLLKSPGCSICNPIVEFNPVPWLEPITLQNLS